MPRLTWSILFPWGWDELEGIANRGDFDLKNCMRRTPGERLEYFDQVDRGAIACRT